MSGILNYGLLERLLSTDLDAQQQFANREWEEVFRLLGARRRDPSLYVPSAEHGTEAVPDSFCVGLEVTRLNTETVRMHPGALAIPEPANIAQGALDSSFRIGRRRDPLDIAVPVTGHSVAYYLLSARIVTTNTLITTVEVFDVPTQSFVLQSSPKWVEHTIETRFDDPGAPGSWTAFDAVPVNEGWEPIAYVRLHADTSDPMQCQIIDVRRDLRDVLQAQSEDPLVADTTASIAPRILQRAIESAAVPTDPAKGGIRGTCVVSRSGHMMGFSRPVDAPGDSIQHSDFPNGAPTPGEVSHYYLAPLKSAGRYRVPSGSTTYVSGSPVYPQWIRGFLITSESVKPTRAGLNSGQLTLPSGLEPVPAGQAVHVCSAVKTGPLAFAPFVMNGNKLRYFTPIELTTNFSAVAIGFVAGGAITTAIDLRSKVPKNAKILRFQILLSVNSSVAADGWVLATIKKGTAVLGRGSVQCRNVLTGFAQEAVAEFEVPIATPNASDATDVNKDAYLNLTVVLEGYVSGNVNNTWKLLLVGWEH